MDRYSETPAGTTGKILIVDDNPHNIKLLDILLKKNNFKTITVSSGPQALKAAAASKPDLIFLDIMMPEMDGFDVCRRLKADEGTRDIPIIFLTSRSDTEGVVRGFEVGAADYVTKPFNKTELLARMKTHIELKRSRDRVIDLERHNSVLAMIATTNHEINQPLTVLSGNIYLIKNLLLKTDLPTEYNQYFKRMEDAIQKIKNILQKYRNAATMRFEKYSSDSQIVIFDEQQEMK